MFFQREEEGKIVVEIVDASRVQMGMPGPLCNGTGATITYGLMAGIAGGGKSCLGRGHKSGIGMATFGMLRSE